MQIAHRARLKTIRAQIYLKKNINFVQNLQNNMKNRANITVENSSNKNLNEPQMVLQFLTFRKL
jgi:hypothetical protein